MTLYTLLAVDCHSREVVACAYEVGLLLCVLFVSVTSAWERGRRVYDNDLHMVLSDRSYNNKTKCQLISKLFRLFAMQFKIPYAY